MNLPILPENPEQKCDAHAPTKSKSRFPSWLRIRLPHSDKVSATNKILAQHQIHTVCEEAKCPNRLECYSRKIATFLALGKECTRNCGFCEIEFSKTPAPPDPHEPLRIAQSVQALGLHHVVITMVTRDDLPDQGASHLAHILQEIRAHAPQVTTEVLTSDFSGNHEALSIVLAEKPEIFNHNLETVRSLSPFIRHKAQYDRSLNVLRYAKETHKSLFVKSGIMVGLGETAAEVEKTLQDLAYTGCDIVTIGQYLQPSKRKLRVKAFISPEQFAHYAQYGQSLGIRHMYCGPRVRSSYHAAELAQKLSTQ